MPNGGTIAFDGVSSTDQKSAHQILKDMLNSFGLGTLAGQLWKEYLTGAPQEVIMANMRASDAYKARFPGMAQLTASGHAITEADYISKESADISLMHAYGLDNMAGDRKFLGNLIGNEVSTTELQQRLDLRSQIVNQLPHEVRDYLQSQYGIHTGDLVGFWANPDRALPELQSKVQAAEVGGAAALSGYGNIDPRQAARLAGIGVNFNDALSGFEHAGELKGLTQNLPGQVNDAVTSDDLVNALMAGDSGASMRVQQEQARRKAGFADQQSVATTAQGAVGLGTANA